MKAANRKTGTRRFKLLILAAMITIVISAVIFYTKNYPIEISEASFWLDAVTNILIFIAVYFILVKMVYKKK